MGLNNEYSLNLAEKLKRRAARLYLLDYRTFHFSLVQFVNFLENEPAFTDLLEDLRLRYPLIESQVNEAFPFKIENEWLTGSGLDHSDLIKISESNQLKIYNYEEENMAAASFIIVNCGKSNNKNIEVAVGASFIRDYWMFFRNKSNGQVWLSLHNADNNKYSIYNEPLERFKSLYFEPLCLYLEEKLDQTQITLSMVTKYKFRCEWFRREELLALSEKADNKKINDVEKRLAFQFYEYLYDNGLIFELDPASPAGKIDIISTPL